MEEIWKDVVRYEGVYEVSNLGRVRRVSTGRILKHLNTRYNPFYPRVSLPVGRKWKQSYVHHMVAEAFLGPRPPKHDVNHKDGNKQNPALSNLEYITHRENTAHRGFIPGSRSRGEGHSNSKLTENQIREIRKVEGIVSRKELAKKYDVTYQAIFNIHKRNTWAFV